jgi:hypothetical protein
MDKQTKTILIISGVLGLGILAYFLLRKPTMTTPTPAPNPTPTPTPNPTPNPTGINTSYSVQNKNWDSNGGYVHLFENGVADYFDKNGFWMFSSNESDSYLVINGVTYSPQSNDLPRQS